MNTSAGLEAFIRPCETAPATQVPRAHGATVQVLLGPDDDMPNFYTRRFTLTSGARIPEHRHDTIEHQQVVLAGEMVLGLDGKEQIAHVGDCLYIPPGCAHWYENRGQAPVCFLCIVPATNDYGTEWLEDPT